MPITQTTSFSARIEGDVKINLEKEAEIQALLIHGDWETLNKLLLDNKNQFKLFAKQTFMSGQSPWQVIIAQLNQEDNHGALWFFRQFLFVVGDDFYHCQFKKNLGQVWNVMDAMATQVPYLRLNHPLDERFSDTNESAYQWTQFKMRLKQAQYSKLILKVANSGAKFFKQHHVQLSQKLEIPSWIRQQFLLSHRIIQQFYKAEFREAFQHDEIDSDVISKKLRSSLATQLDSMSTDFEELIHILETQGEVNFTFTAHDVYESIQSVYCFLSDRYLIVVCEGRLWVTQPAFHFLDTLKSFWGRIGSAYEIISAIVNNKRATSRIIGEIQFSIEVGHNVLNCALPLLIDALLPSNTTKFEIELAYQIAQQYLEICGKYLLLNLCRDYSQIVSPMGLPIYFNIAQRFNDFRSLMQQNFQSKDNSWHATLSQVFPSSYVETPVVDFNMKSLVSPKEVGIELKAVKAKPADDIIIELNLLEACQHKNWRTALYLLKQDQNPFRIYNPGESPFQFIVLNAEPTPDYLSLLKYIAELLFPDFNAITFHLIDNTFLTFMGAFASYVSVTEHYSPIEEDLFAYHEFFLEMRKIQAALQLLGQLNAPIGNQMGLLNKAVFRTTGMSAEMLHSDLLRLHRKFALFHQFDGFNQARMREIDEVFRSYQFGRHINVDALIQRLSRKLICAFEIRTDVMMDGHSIGVLLVPEKDKNAMQVWITNRALYSREPDEAGSAIDVYYTTHPEVCFATLMTLAQNRCSQVHYNSTIKSLQRETNVAVLSWRDSGFVFLFPCRQHIRVYILGRREC